MDTEIREASFPSRSPSAVWRAENVRPRLRTQGRALRVDEADGDGLALDQVAIEMKPFSVLVEHFDVRHRGLLGSRRDLDDPGHRGNAVLIEQEEHVIAGRRELGKSRSRDGDTARDGRRVGEPVESLALVESVSDGAHSRTQLAFSILAASFVLTVNVCP
jgi:hypothetical protein